MKWQKNIIITENLIVGVRKLIVFQAKEDLVDVAHLSSSCGCSTPTQSGNTIVVKFTPNPIPIHLLHLGYYKVNMKILVTYKDGTQDTLKFKSKITNKK